MIRAGIFLIAVLLLAGCSGEPPASEPAAAPPADTSAAEAAPEPVPEPEPEPEPEPAVTNLTMDEILLGDHRGAGRSGEPNSARDPYRNPKETLEFFGLTPETKVVEIWPAGGWYTEVIAPYVNASGKYYAAQWDPELDNEMVQRTLTAYNEKLAAHPELYGNVEVLALGYPNKLDFIEPGTVDMVLTFRNVHNWMRFGYADKIFAASYQALRPGGVLGVVEHRGNPDVEQDPEGKSGYVREDYTIELARAAGFELDASSDINDNPADTKDYPEGVWGLPPTLRGAGEDNPELRAERMAIGESDRYTLRFIKPVE